MLQSISWSSYFSTLAFLLLVYYLFVAYTYFKWDILKMFGISKVNKEIAISASFTALHNNYDEAKTSADSAFDDQTDLSTIIQGYVDEVKAYLEEAAENHIVKEEILFAVQQISTKYQTVFKADTANGVMHEIYRLVTRQFPNIVTLDELRPYLKS